MPKQAIALLVHQNSDQVNTLIKLLEKDFDIYIHIDKKSTVNIEDIASANSWKKYKVKWGGYSMVQATVLLYNKILETGNPYTHIILLSADSLPVKSNSFIADYLSGNKGISFIENNGVSGIREERRALLWFNEDIKKKSLSNIIFRLIRRIQRKLNIKRSAKGFERIGSQWTILSLEHVKHLLEHCRFSDYWSMAVPDESFVQNHFFNYNIPYNENKIYAHWPEPRTHSPGFIDQQSFLSLVQSDYLFDRKFNTDLQIAYQYFNAQEADKDRASSR
ncbi:MAG: hypothetical protein J7497_06725 [Chitinophagaceae bacterium]|nr:hypothetical protein [Chitinophagaceae bacterium]